MAEKKIVLKNCGVIDPKNIESYIKQEGFEALRKAKTMTPDAVIAEVKASRLKGRGGAGFPCGVKWEIARSQRTEEKYLICNADEGEMGTFKDRYIIQNDPFTLVEGVAIASYAIGVKKAYIYLRAEYHYLLSLLQGAIDQAREKGLLEGLEIEICEGAGRLHMRRGIGAHELHRRQTRRIALPPPLPSRKRPFRETDHHQ